MDMILREGFPSYRHWSDEGITTMAETWNRTNSDNHHMFSDVCRWFIRYVAGLGKMDFQRRTITFIPDFVSPLDYAEASTESGAGKFSCRWERRPGGFDFTCLVPGDFSVTLAPAGPGRAVEAAGEKAEADGHIRRDFFIKAPGT
jgi:hypothetical protein